MRKPIIAATLAATMLLAGCGKGTNIPKKYKDFFEYTFGGDYTAEKTVSEKDYRKWDISYTDPSGDKHTAEYQWAAKTS